MAHHTEKSLTVNVSTDKIWQVLADYSSVERFAITIKSSPLVGDIQSGLGAKRKCTFNDGSSLVEEIIDYQDGIGFKMALSEFSLPLKHMEAEMKVTPLDENRSEIYMSSDFVVKGGIFGRFLGHFVMRPIMKGVFTKVMTGLAFHSATGKILDDKLPKNEDLEQIVL